jgi:hypothetical protein
MPGTSYVSVNQSAPGTLTVKAAEAGLRHKVAGGFLVLSAIGTLKFEDGTQDLSGAMNLDQKAGFVLPIVPAVYFQTAVGEPLQITTTGGAAKGTLVVITE